MLRFLNRGTGKVTNYVRCIGCGILVPAIEGDWDVSCEPCAKAYDARLRADRYEAAMRVRKYCTVCEGPHRVAAGYHIR